MENVFLDRAAPRFESPVPVRLPDQRVVELTVRVLLGTSVCHSEMGLIILSSTFP